MSRDGPHAREVHVSILEQAVTRLLIEANDRIPVKAEISTRMRERRGGDRDNGQDHRRRPNANA